MNTKESYLLIENKKRTYLILLGCGLMTIFTVFLLFPLASYIVSKHTITRKYIDGRQLTYTGKVGKIFLIFYVGLAALVLCVLAIEILLRSFNLLNSIPHQTLNSIPGILAGFFIRVVLNRYNQKNTHFVDVKDGVSGFKFHIWLFLGKYVVTRLVKIISIWFLFPLSSRMSTYYDYRRGYIDGYHFTYKFSLRKMYPKYLLDLLLTVVTIFFYAPLLILNRLEIDQTFVHIATEEELTK